MFCIAITCVFLGSRYYQETLHSFNQVLHNEIIYEQSMDIEEAYYTKGKIIAILLNQLDYDIEVDGVVISKWDNIKDKIASYPIKNKNFQKTYLYDNDGNILRIIFNSI